MRTLFGPLATARPWKQTLHLLLDLPLGIAWFTWVVTMLSGLTAAQRAKLSGVSATRSAQVLGGALVAQAAMDLLGVDEVTICPWALREGLILRRLDTLSDIVTDTTGWIGDA